MPSLGKYDPLDHQLATKESVDSMRSRAESVVKVGSHTLQFDSVSRERMRLVLKGSEGGDLVNWKMYDNSVVSFSKEELETLYQTAEIEAGKRLLHVHAKAQTFKEAIDSGMRVTLRDIRLDNW